MPFVPRRRSFNPFFGLDSRLWPSRTTEEQAGSPLLPLLGASTSKQGSSHTRASHTCAKPFQESGHNQSAMIGQRRFSLSKSHQALARDTDLTPPRNSTFTPYKSIRLPRTASAEDSANVCEPLHGRDTLNTPSPGSRSVENAGRVGVARTFSLSDLKIPPRISSTQAKIGEDLKRVRHFKEGIEGKLLLIRQVRSGGDAG